MGQYVLSGEAAKMVGLSKDRLLQLANKGQIKSIRTTGGTRLFDRDDVARFAEERRKRNAKIRA